MITLIHRHRGPLLLLVALSLLIGIISTWNGVNYGTDGLTYMVYARAFVQGQGFIAPVSTYQSPVLTTPLSGWPPLYPLILALGGASSDFARALSIVLLVAAAILTYALGLTLFEKRGPSLAAALLFLSLPVTGQVYSGAWSESLFVVLTLLTVTIMVRAYRMGEPAISYGPALAAGFLTMLVALTRFVGVALAGSMVLYSGLWAWCRNKRVTRRGLVLPVIFALSMVPLALFILYLRAETSSITGTQAILNRFSPEEIGETALEILTQLLHGILWVTQALGLKSNWWTVLFGGCLTIAIGVQLWPNRRIFIRSLHSSHLAMGLFVVCYLTVFIVMSVITASVVPASRHFLVIYPLLLIVVIQLLLAARIPRGVLTGVLTLYLLSGTFALQEPAAGLLYNRTDWRTNPILLSLSEMVPPGTVLHEMRGWYGAFLVPDTPVRIFGGDASFLEYSCKDVLYLPDYPYAGYILIDSPILRTWSYEDVHTYFRKWAEPCGVVANLTHDAFALYMLVRLNDSER